MQSPATRNTTARVILAAVAGAALLALFAALVRSGHADLMRSILPTSDAFKGANASTFSGLTDVADKMAKSLLFPVLAIAPLGGGIGVLMMSVGSRAGSGILIASLSGPFILLFVMAAAA